MVHIQTPFVAHYAGLRLARQLGVPITVIVPSRTSALMRDRIAPEGGEVIVEGTVWDDAHALAMSLATPERVLLHPFDHPDVWAGNASLVHELAADLREPPGTILLSVGGGGLLLGVLKGLADVGWRDAQVVASETTGAASLKASLDAGSLVSLPGIDSIALTLGAKTVARQAFEQAAAWPVRSVAVSDTAAVQAVQQLLEDHRLLVEPACGAALAPLSDPAVRLDGPVVAVVCGGSAVTPAMLAAWNTDLGL